MNWLKMNRGKIAAVIIVALLLGIAYFSSGEPPEENNTEIKKEETKKLVLPQDNTDSEKEKTEVEPDAESEAVTVSESKLENEKEDVPENEEITEESNAEKEAEKSHELKNEIKADSKTSDNNEEQPVKSEEKPEKEPTEEEQTKVDDKRNLCTLSVRCDTINQNLELLDKSKHGLIPTDGVILNNKNISFEEGDSVFDVLLREMKNNNIHFEYVKTPMYDGVYIEGIGNIYEFDCGARSGWLYCVNGEFPGYSSSQYKLKSGDVIEFLYTCDMGKDVGK